MRLSLFHLLLLGYIVAVSSGGGKKEKVHLKIHVPKIIKHHHHTKIVFVHKKDDHKKDHGHKKGHDDHGHDDHKEKKKHVVVIHKHQHNHKHKHDHGHKHGHKHNHKHDGKHSHKHDHKGQHKHTHEVKKSKKSHDDHGHGGYDYGGHDSHGHDGGYDYSDHGHGGHYTYEPSEDYDEGYENLRNVKSERYEVETVDNPHGFQPNRYVVKTSYKVKEHNPYDHTTKGYHRQYQYPAVLAKQGYYKYARVTDSYDGHSNKYIPFPPVTGYQEAQEVEEQQDHQNEDLQEQDKPTETLGNYVDYDYPAAADTRNVENFKLRSGNLDQYLRKDHEEAPEAFAEVPVDEISQL